MKTQWPNRLTKTELDQVYHLKIDFQSEKSVDEQREEHRKELKEAIKTLDFRSLYTKKELEQLLEADRLILTNLLLEMCNSGFASWETEGIRFHRKQRKVNSFV